MVMQVVTVPYGAPAHGALERAVDAAKGGDPLAPVTIVVPANSVGVATRRALARRPGGVIGVQLLTVYRLAELLGAPPLAASGRRPVSTPVLAAAVRRVLRERDTIFSGVREHAATEAALITTHRALSDCSAAALDAIAANGRRAHDVVRVHRAVRSLLSAEWFDERDLIDAAITALQAGSPLASSLGTTIVHLPQPLSHPQQSLLRVLAESHEVIVLEGSTGADAADAAVRDTVSNLTGARDDRPLGNPVARATELRSVSDADEEARAAVRDVVAALHDGVPIDRIAVLYTTREPYARLLHEHCAAANLVVNGMAVRTLADSIAGRFLLRLLALPDSQFGRAEVCAWLAGAPVRDGTHRAPSAQWEAVSRRAGVVAGDDWDVRLPAHARAQRREADEERRVPDRDAHPEHYVREADAADALHDFVVRLRAALAPADRTWAQHADWAKRLIGELLGREGVRAHWPEVEQRAAAAVDAALDRLGALDAVDDEPPSRAVFRRTLELELAADLGRAGRQGVGLLVAPLSFGLGLDLDRLVVVGAAEGLLPARRTGDPLLTDDDRVAAGGELRLVADAVHDDHRALLTAIASCRAGGRVTLSYPRGDLRRTAELRPSRFADGVPVRTVPSFFAGVAAAVVPATEQDHRLRALAADEPCDDADGRFARAVECVRSRASDGFTRFDGNVSRVAALVPGPARDGGAISATSLQDWASNPFEYFVGKVLRAEIPEAPEERFELSPLDRGSLVHEILEQWLQERLDAGDVPAPDVPWSARQRARLAELAQLAFADYEHKGLTGRAVFWGRDRVRILRDLEQLCDEDDRWRAETRTTPHAAELDFGLLRSPRPAAELVLDDGRVVRLRGSADRIDVDDAGGIHVIDYKTGKANGQAKVDADDPVERGTKLQLPIYALAGRAAMGAPRAAVHASYWFITARENFARRPLHVDDAVQARAAAVIAEIVDGIEAGVFPCRPPDKDSWFPKRTYSDPDALGSRDLARAWLRKRGDAVLARYCALAGEEVSP